MHRRDKGLVAVVRQRRLAHRLDTPISTARSRLAPGAARTGRAGTPASPPAGCAPPNAPYWPAEPRSPYGLARHPSRRCRLDSPTRSLIRGLPWEELRTGIDDVRFGCTRSAGLSARALSTAATWLLRIIRGFATTAVRPSRRFATPLWSRDGTRSWHEIVSIPGHASLARVTRVNGHFSTPPATPWSRRHAGRAPTRRARRACSNAWPTTSVDRCPTARVLWPSLNRPVERRAMSTSSSMGRVTPRTTGLPSTAR
jgi:hypothetical protein